MGNNQSCKCEFIGTINHRLFINQNVHFVQSNWVIFVPLNLLVFKMFTQDAYKLKSIGSLHNQNNEQSWLTDGSDLQRTVNACEWRH